jgi:hypothetical protein
MMRGAGPKAEGEQYGYKALAYHIFKGLPGA